MIDIDWYNLISSDKIKTFGVPFLTTLLMIIVKMISRKTPNKKGIFEKYFTRENFNFGLQLIVTSFSIYLIGGLIKVKTLVESDKAASIIFNDVTNIFWKIALSLLAIISLSLMTKFYGWEKKRGEDRPRLFIGVLLPDIIGIISLSLVVNALN